MMVPPRSVSCYEIGHAPKADEEDIAYIDGTDDDIEPEPPSAASQRSSIVTSASSRISLISRGTLRSSVDKNEDTKRSKKMVVCRVALLDGSTFEPKGIDKNSDGQIVYDKVVNHLDVIETDYFGLTFRDKTGKKFWLDNSKKISKQVKGGTWVFEFQVKFYPPDPMSLKEDITRYQLCLQVRVDIFNGRLPCSFATYALLGSYTVQAELGDWDPSEYGSGLGYLNDFDFAPTQNQELLEKIQELHQSNKGQTPEVAEAHFLENTKKLAMYGVDMHDVKDSENKPLSLGISANGILVYKDRLRINRFVWPKILKLSYKRNTFYVKIRPSEFEQLERTLGFLCDSHKLAKRLWKTCVEHHAFFRLKTSDPPNSDTLFPRFNTRFRYSGRTAIQARKAAEMQHRDEPHIARTAERRSMVDKSKNQDGGALKKKPVDESDKFDKKQGDPDATLERDHNLAGLDQDGRYAQAPGTGDAADKHGFKGEEPGTEGPPGYAADTSALSDGGKKSKKDKEDEKKRKKEEERKRKEEEKERKRLEKLEKDKKKKAAQETNIDEVTVDPAVLEQKDKEKKHGGGGLFAKLGRKSQKDKEKEVNRPANIPVAVDDHMEQKPKPIQTWALPGMKEMMERRALTNQTEAGEVSVKQELPTIQVDEVENLDPETQEYETDYQSPSAQTGSTSLSDSSAEIENQSDTIIKEEYQSTSLSRGEHSGDTILSEQLKEDYMNLLRETPAITSQSRLEDVKHKIDQDPRYVAVGNDDRRQKWFNEYVDDMLKADFMRLLSEKPTIHSQSTWPEARPQIDQDPRFDAVGDEALREKWFNEYVQGLLKSEFMQLLKETPAVHSQSRWDGVKDYLENDPRYQAVGSDPQREAWFDEYLENLKKEEFMQLLGDTPSITSYSHYADAREDISHDPRFHNVDTEEQRQAYFNEYIQNLLKEDYTQLLRETPDITSQSRLEDVKHEIDQDPRYVAVANDDRRKKWFKEYVDDMLKADYMRLLRETPTIHSQSTWPEARQEIDRDPRFDAVRSEAVRQKWFNEYVQGLLKSEFMQLLKETPAVHSQSRWDGVKDYLENDPRYQAVGSDPQREAWFDEYIENLKKDEFMQLLADTPSITSYSLYRDAREDISHDPRFHNVDTEEQRKAYFNEYTQNLKKADFVQLLQDTPDISAQSRWHESKQHIDRDPRYHAVDSDLLRAKWFNEYVNALAGFGYGDVDYGLKSGGFKSIDRKQEFLPLIIPSVATKKSSEEPMPFFANARESEVYPIDRKKVPPPVARKPKGGYDSEEDRLMNNGVPVTVETESYKYNPDTSDVPRSTSNIPIVETKTHKVTYEKDGIPYETEDSILISAHSVTTKSQTIDTTTYKTERDGVIETRVERKITVMTDEDDDLDHDALLRAAIEEVTNMNPDMSVEKIECMRQIEEKR